ncbi:glucose-1-phosphate adenylyltransferase [Boudabousia marimammalium]|uniref:Glucose-1-phosphate adenylyltransferase n=1 Tax=Boudabousia marimammalium TaxID=156892 RepID=A0A1Q5PR90_9ACTO|nr:glucose-1-phosphate adenylyltransferase [Boudabousia marimammalium]OKL50067.1 glucose-1-phosphate adenylyltransferase [Boudabousia marimammalium]
MSNPRVLAIVLAGGEGKRLMPLTVDRAKPAVPFGGHYRLIDFSLSNIVNSGFLQVVVLTQYKSHSLDRHVTLTWRMSNLLGNFVAPVPAQQRMGKHWFLGSADAIYQSMNIVEDEKPDYIVITGADNIYRMDFSQMLDHHIASGLPCTVAGIRQPLSLANQFGVIEAKDGVITNFLEKPENCKGLPDAPDQVLASMGNYIFTTKDLKEALSIDAQDSESAHDMGGNIVPYFVSQNAAGVYDFIDNDVPGALDRDRDYWRDVGTLDAYYEANMDLVSVNPVFNLYNQNWPVFTGLSGSFAPAKFVYGSADRMGVAIDSIVSPSVIISGGKVQRSVLSPGVYVHSWADISGSVLMHSTKVGRGAVVHRAILDKNCVVEPGAQVGVDLDRDRERGLTVTESGIVVAPKGLVIRK